MSELTTIFAARKIITIDPQRPLATHVAVREGSILGVGSLAELERLGEHRLDATFADKVLMPGLVEGHAHVSAGANWRFPYVGFYDRYDADGKLWSGCKTVDAVVDRLSEHITTSASPDGAILAWGVDPLFLDRGLSAADLDRVSSARPVLVLHLSSHLLYVNNETMRRANITSSTTVEGVTKDAGGEPTGELVEFAAMGLAWRHGLQSMMGGMTEPSSIRDFGRLAQRAGVTTIADLGSLNLEDRAAVAAFRDATSDAEFPVRIVQAHTPRATGLTPDETAAYVKQLADESTDKQRMGAIKLFTDGSIQGFSARLNEPYLGGRPNGIWNMAPEELAQHVAAYHRAGVQVHTHCNGDEASAAFIDAVEAAIAQSPARDHRHTLQHGQLADAAQFRRMAALGMCANLFANHVYYWGDVHRDRTLGPARAARIDACRSALAAGIPLAIHCDADVTPIAPLFTAWVAVNRRTATDQPLGEDERITVNEALHAITLGAAYTLKLDHEIGSITSGKRADFCVLDEDPTACAPADLKDIPISGTVLGGQIFTMT